jgi:hypothetical protein
MTETENTTKILLIKMIEVGDVCCIGVPAMRHIKRLYPEAELHFLTYAAGAEFISLAEPDVSIMTLPKDSWPDDILAAMEAFLGLAEEIVGVGYTNIINLDTAFMPCFLARFLKDAGETIEGNYLSVSLQHLIEQIQNQSLSADYVNNASVYMQSSFFTMSRWNTNWWEGALIPDSGYPEYFLRHCCSYHNIEMDYSIEVEPDKTLKKRQQSKKVIALSFAKEGVDPYASLANKLVTAGFEVWKVDPNTPHTHLLEKLKATDLLVAVPGAEQWYANAVGCPALIVCGEMDPKILMPEYATEVGDTPKVSELAESIESIFTGNIDD